MNFSDACQDGPSDERSSDRVTIWTASRTTHFWGSHHYVNVGAVYPMDIEARLLPFPVLPFLETPGPTASRDIVNAM